MKTPIFGLRAGILTQLILLIIAAMLLINIAILNLYEKDLIKAREQAGSIMVLSVENLLGYTIKNNAADLVNLQSDMDAAAALRGIIKAGEFSDLVIVNNNGETVFRIGFSGDKRQYGHTMAVSAMSTLTQSINFTGNTWGVLWPRKGEICLSSPLKYKGRLIGGISAISSLVPVYEILRRSEKLVILYIILDTVILALVGIYLLSRIVVSPIHRLLRMTEEYEDNALIPSAGDTPANEIGNLSRALTNMLKRLDENKKELRSHIVSLEKANRELKTAQNEIIRSEKLASIGRLAAGIAHEIGNPVGIILGYIDLIRKGGLSREEEKDFLVRAEKEITRVNIIIRQLLDFSRNTTELIEKCGVHDLIINTVEMLSPQSRMKELNITLDLAAEKDYVLADKNQLQQVFLNILINSIDALDEAGPDIADAHIEISSKNKNGFLELRFIDNGPGISSDEIGSIFDPFYTTKEPGRGTGLGLSVCYRIIEGLGGAIKAKSPPGKGMTIFIELPVNERLDNMSQGEPR